MLYAVRETNDEARGPYVREVMTELTVDDEVANWTLSEDSTKVGWKTEDGYDNMEVGSDGLGLPFALAKEIVRRYNEMEELEGG